MPIAPPAAFSEDDLLDVASAYMDSLTGNDPDGAPFASGVRSTENGIETPFTQGLWMSARGWLYRHTFVDTVTGEIGAFGSIRETGERDAMIALRLKVVAGQIAESELLVAREGDFPLFTPRAVIEPRPAFTSFAPIDRRLDRAKLAAIPDRYFQAIVHGDPGRVGVHPDANRFENGVQTTNSPLLRAPSAAEGLRRLVYMQHYRDLRVPVIDPARGLVLAIVAFDMPELTRTLRVRGRPIEITPERQRLPRTMVMFELFKLEGERIRSIEAVMRNMAMGAALGWPPTAP